MATLDKAANGKGDRQEACGLTPTFLEIEKEERE